MPEHRFYRRCVEERSVIVSDDAEFGLLVNIKTEGNISLLPNRPLLLEEISAERIEHPIPGNVPIVYETFE